MFITNFSERMQRVVIPVMIEPCERPELLKFVHSVDFFRGDNWEPYWQKLQFSLKPVPTL